MVTNIFSSVLKRLPADTVHAHCDGPCGVYDPAQARVHAEAVVSMTKKLVDLQVPDTADKQALLAYHNTLARYVAIKEQEAHAAKEDLLVLWTDYFKPGHLEQFPDLHDVFWKAAKLCSSCKVEVSLEHAQELLETVHKIHDLFWKSKGKDVPWITAS
jgi:nickel superoxide dismutase